MTTIVAQQVGNDVLFGWDSLSVQGNEKAELLTPKVFANGGVVYGVAGNARVLDLLAYSDLPEYDGSEPRRWLVTKWIPEMRALFQEEPAMVDEEGAVEGAMLLVAVGGRVFETDPLLFMAERRSGMYTLGSGGQFALGALLAGATVYGAVRVAADLDPYTGGTIHSKLASELVKESGWTMPEERAKMEAPSEEKEMDGKRDRRRLRRSG